MKQIHPKFVVPLLHVTTLTWLFRGLFRSVKVYWFAWQAFYPQTGLWRAE